jgi:tellurite resistance protein
MRALYEHLQGKILELIESLDALRASAEYEVIRFVEQDASVIDSMAAGQREELEQEIAELKAEAERVAKEARELAGEVPF